MKNFLRKLHLDNLQLERQQFKNGLNEWKKIDTVKLTDDNAVPFHLHIGMRTIKTVVAVFICGIIGWAVGQQPLFSMFAAILCVQNKTDDTIKSAFNRIIGTLVGGFYSVTLVYLCWVLGISEDSFLYYTLISFTLIPVIITTLYIRKPTTTSLSCIVLVAITLSEFHDLNPLFTAIWRMIDTLIGIMVILCIEVSFPYKPKEVSTSVNRISEK